MMKKRMTRRRSGPSAAVFSMGILALSVLSSGACQKTAPDTIRIAVAGPMTGDQSKQGNDLKNGVELAVAEWNGKGGLLGKKIELLVGDDQHDPKQAVSIANRFVNSGVVGVVGHWNSSASIPASEVYHQAMIPMITPASTNPRVTDRGYRNVFRVCGRDDQQGRVAAEFAARELRVRRVAVLHDKTTYGQGLADEFRKALESMKDRPVETVHYGGITQGDKDFRGVLTTVAAKKPDLLYFGGIYPEGGLLVKQAKEVGLKAPMMSGDGVIDPVFVQIAGPSAEGTYLTFTPDTAQLPQAREVLEHYRARYGEPGPYSLYAYDAAQLLLTAIQRSGMTDGFEVSESLHRMVYDGVTGRIEFDEKGDIPKMQYVVWLTKNGKFEEIWKPAGM
jgi:branched-chain amino acid transport system substrate-binding protein